MNVERGALNRIFLDGQQTVTPSYFLLVFSSVTSGLNVYAVTTNSGAAAGPLLLPFEEMDGGATAPLDAQINLSPPGDWDLTVYEQKSGINLDPANALRTVGTMQLRVDGDACSSSEYAGTPCPPCAGACARSRPRRRP